MKNNYPVILLKGLVLLPLGEARIELNNSISKKIIDISKKFYKNEILIVTPLNNLEENPDTSDLPYSGVLGNIVSRIDLPNGNTRIVIKGIKRVNILSYNNYLGEKEILESEVIDYPYISYNEALETALYRKLLQSLDNYISANPFISNSIVNQIKGIDNLESLTDYVGNFLPLKFDKKLTLMLENNRIIRAKKLISEINIEIEVLKIDEKLDNDLKVDLDNMQKEMILKEKIKLIKEELGERDSKREYINRISDTLGEYPSNISKRISDELVRYEYTLETSPEMGVIKTYIDYLTKIPFNIYSEDETDLKVISDKLNSTHYGLNEVKSRIIEYVAVKSNNPIICLIGPPGVGKTTLAESIAESLNKKFVKISLGGINDPAELVGHKRAYIGSTPGKIINAIIKSHTMNPLILLDEVDKMSKDYKGDPTSVLLDLLDDKQSKEFTDNYIEEKIDLSNVTFILTANDRNSIPEVLLDRVELIELSSYLNYEKLSIATNYLIKNNMKLNNINNNIKFNKEAVKYIIENYTKESGVRELERLINKILRKIVTEYKLNNKELKSYVIGIKDVKKYLGLERYSKEYSKYNKPGIMKGLAYTPYGGEVLEIEVTSYPGKEEFITSGHLGETLKESIMVSIGYIKSNKNLFNLNRDAFNKTLHINFREGGIPKEGPSAGTVITTTILSELLGIEVPPNVSSSGEITLLGDVLPVGGLREKCISAIKNNIDTIYLSVNNKRDIEYLDKEITNKIKFIFVKNYKDIYNSLFKGKKDTLN